MKSKNPMNGQFPVHSELEVIDGTTIYKNNKWWKAVLLVDGFHGQEVAVYLWNRDNGTWKRQQKYVIRSITDWDVDREAIESYLNELTES